MTGGVLLVHGNAGDQVGHTMRRGLIAVGGDVGDFAAINMIAGSLFVLGACGLRPAAAMRRGTLAVFNDRPELLPTFRSGGHCEPLFLSVYLGKLADMGFAAPYEWRARRPMKSFTATCSPAAAARFSYACEVQSWPAFNPWLDTA